MALPAAFLSEDQFTCSICLDVFNNPVSTPCGHSFCQVCISSYWDKKSDRQSGGASKAYQCPLCKESFRKRPELHINRTLKEITERFKSVADSGVGVEMLTLHQQMSGPPVAPKPREIPETVFAEMMNRFQQLQTPGASHQTLSYPSSEHPQSLPPPPYSPPRRYTLSGPSETSLNLPLCPIHLRGLEFFCRTDNTCVCSSCVETSEHRGHNIIPAKREWHIKKSQLGITEVEIKDVIGEKERKVEEIRNSMQEIQAAAQRETDGTVHVFSKLISNMERCQSEVLEVIELARRVAENRAQNLLEELEEEIAELKKRKAALSQLALTEDYLYFFKMFPNLSTLPHHKDWSNISVVSELSSGVILKTVTHLTESWQEEIRKLPEVCNSLFRPGQRSLMEQSVSRPNPKIKRVQEYADDITLDPNTAHPRLMLSVDGKKVQCGERHQLVPDNPERFDRVVCVLARQGFSSGRHYWEVEVGGKTDWDLGIASSSVNRKGKITVSPAHGYWFLSLRDRTDYAFRTEPSTSLTVASKPSRVGIYVDYDKGIVSFYNVDARVLIYTFTDTFYDTIHPFFSPCTNKSGRNEAPLIILPVTVT